MCLGSSYADPDADQDDSKVSDEDENDCDSEENIRKELTRLISMVRYLLPVVGQSVEVIKLGCCPGLTNGLVSLFIPTTTCGQYFTTIKSGFHTPSV